MDQHSQQSQENAHRDKMRRDRTRVRQRRSELRQHLSELQTGQQQGLDNVADIEACKGEIKVLEKEIQSIEESGHTTFMAAKEMLDPKKDVSAKNRSIKERRVQLNRSIAELELALTDTSLTPENRQLVLADLAKLKEERTTLAEESKALQEYNHTRFLETRKEDDDSQRQEEDLHKINEKIFAAETDLHEAMKSGDQPRIAAAKDGLHLLLMEKESIENYTHDLFLQNLERMKAKHQDELL